MVATHNWPIAADVPHPMTGRHCMSPSGRSRRVRRRRCLPAPAWWSSAAASSAPPPRCSWPRRATPVVLCEKGRIGGEQSSRNWGWCRTMGRDAARDPAGAGKPAPLARHERSASGGKPASASAASSTLCETAKEARRAGGLAGPGAPVSRWTPICCGRATTLPRVLPGAALRHTGALHTPSDGRAEPAQAAPAIAEAARAHGATILTELRGARRRDAGRAGRRRGDRTGPHRLRRGGAGGRRLVAAVLRQLPGGMRPAAAEGAGLGVPHQTARPARRRPPAGSGIFAFRKRLDGGYSIARRNANYAEITPELVPPVLDFLPTLRKLVSASCACASAAASWRSAGTQATLVARPAHAVRGGARARPGAAGRPSWPRPARRCRAPSRSSRGMQVAESWGGMIDVTPDAVPVIYRGRGRCPASSRPPAFPATASASVRAPAG